MKITFGLYDANMNLIPLLVLSIILYGVLRLLEVRKCKITTSEPPIVYSRIPIVGHALGLFRYGVSYYRMLR
jgi:hypothetical protein